ncbi:hypothetical protein ACHAPU_003210 [Fusarium lateritium]
MARTDLNNAKIACETCLRGHRVVDCDDTHTDPCYYIRGRGRPRSGDNGERQRVPLQLLRPPVPQVGLNGPAVPAVGPSTQQVPPHVVSSSWGVSNGPWNPPSNMNQPQVRFGGLSAPSVGPSTQQVPPHVVSSSWGVSNGPWTPPPEVNQPQVGFGGLSAPSVGPFIQQVPPQAISHPWGVSNNPWTPPPEVNQPQGGFDGRSVPAVGSIEEDALWSNPHPEGVTHNYFAFSQYAIYPRIGFGGPSVPVTGPSMLSRATPDGSALPDNANGTGPSAGEDVYLAPLSQSDRARDFDRRMDELLFGD